MAGRTPWAGPGGFGDDVLVGRAVERNLLDRAAEHVQANTPQLVVVEGRPGVGKSALVRAFAAARGDEFVVLW
nr:ATP-binding protein [Acidimicrobiia bacterium]